MGRGSKFRCRAGVSLHVPSTQRSGIPLRILRCANVYGEGQRTSGQGAVAAFIESLTLGRTVQLYGNGEVVRDFVHIDDVAAATLQLKPKADTGSEHIVNVGSVVGTDLAQLLRLIEQTLRRKATVTHQPARPFDVRRNVLDVSRLLRLTSISPMSLETGLKRTTHTVGC